MRALARLVLAMSLFLTLVVPVVASAQATPAPQEFVFPDGVDVGGSPESNPIETLSVPSPTGRTSLIKIRSQFVDAIFDSARSL